MTKNNSTKEDNQKIYNDFRQELQIRQLSNTENYDKLILTFSSTGLILSLTFIRYFNHDNCFYLVIISWVLFLLCIFLSLSAYLMSNSAIPKLLQNAEDEYIHNVENALDREVWQVKWNSYLNYLVGFVFIVAMTLLVIFVTNNLNQTSSEELMTKEKKPISQIDESADFLKAQRIATNDSAEFLKAQKAKEDKLKSNDKKSED